MTRQSLADLIGGSYRIALEESWYHERPEMRIPNRRWYEQIPCRGGGFISLYSETPTVILQLYSPRVKKARLIFEQIKQIPGCVADFHMDGEAVIYFPAEIVHKVAGLAFARKRRHLSQEHKEKLTRAGVNALAEYRLSAKNLNSTDEETA
jgi:hypothetical protein